MTVVAYHGSCLGTLRKPTELRPVFQLGISRTQIRLDTTESTCFMTTPTFSITFNDNLCSYMTSIRWQRIGRIWEEVLVSYC